MARQKALETGLQAATPMCTSGNSRSRNHSKSAPTACSEEGNLVARGAVVRSYTPLTRH